MRQKTSIRQQEIIASARRIIASRGIKGLSVKALASGVGITPGGIYRHFRSKENVVLAVIGEIESTLFERIDHALRETSSPLEQLAYILREHLSTVERRGGISFMVMSDVVRTGHERLRLRMKAVIDRYLATIEEILERGVQCGEIDPSINRSGAAVVLLGLVQGAAAHWQLGNFSQPLGDRYQALWQVYLKGVASSATAANVGGDHGGKRIGVHAKRVRRLVKSAGARRGSPAGAGREVKARQLEYADNQTAKRGEAEPQAKTGAASFT